MSSIYWLVILFCGTFFWNYMIKKKEGIHYSEIQLILVYLLTRVILLSQMTETTKGQFLNFFLEILVIALLKLWLDDKVNQMVRSCIIMLYLCNPLILVCLLSKRCIRLLVVCIGVLLLIGIAWRCGYVIRKNQVRKLWIYSYSFSLGGYFYFLSKDVGKNQWSMLASNEESYPMLLVGATMLVILMYGSLVHLFMNGQGVRRLFRRNTYVQTESYKIEADKEQDREISLESISEEADDVISLETFFCGNWKRQKKEENDNNLYKLTPIARVTKLDLICILLITAFSAVLTFVGLGSKIAPESGYHFNYSEKGESQLILKFDQEVHVSKIQIFLGNKSKRKFALSSLNETTGEWKVFNHEAMVNSVFNWNEIEINQNIKTLGAVCMDGTGVLLEMVIFDQNGTKILPSNAADYPELFDEQEKYPKATSYYYRTMFDEVYHARTAYETLHGLDIYEISHPPLGKDLMSIGIALYGMTPFGWRFVVAVCGILMTPLFYIFGLRITKKTKYAIASSLLLNFEFSHFTLSRIATIDIIVALFIMMSFFFLYCFMQKEQEYIACIDEMTMVRIQCHNSEIKILLMAGISIGCAMATKWTGVYAAVGLAVLFFVFMITEYKEKHIRVRSVKHLKKLFWTCVLSFIIIPIAIYILSYLPYTKSWNKNVVPIAFENGKYMLHYHEKTVFDHPYSSNWYEWAWMKKPLFDAIYRYGDGTENMVSTFGNPLIWWSGIVALFYNIYLWLVKKNKTARFLCISYIAMLMPWIFIHRTVFIYQYFVCALLLILMLIHSLSMVTKRPTAKLIAFVSIAAVLFIMFYPVISGMRISHYYVRNVLKWMPSWTFMG